MTTIDLDANATTPLHHAAAEAMARVNEKAWGNPASGHALGKKARQFLEDARESVAKCLWCHPGGVIFTSGATESNNLAVFGLAGEQPGQLVASPIEHPCVLEPLKALEKRGFTIDWLPVRPDGTIDPAEVHARVTRETKLVAVMLANHETGAVNEVRRMAGERPFHCDAAQAVGKMHVDFDVMKITTMSLSAHKFGGPRGIGALVMKAGENLFPPRVLGGLQERGLRPGSVPVNLACGMAAALEAACRDLDENRKHWSRLRERFISALRQRVPPVVVNGDGLPNTANVAFPGCYGAWLLISLDMAGIACTGGAACSSGSTLPSPVIQAMSVPEDVLASAIRFSFRADITEEQIDEAVGRITRCVQQQRQTVPSSPAPSEPN